MKKLAITVLISFCASSAALAGDGRIEISQADMASPPYEITNSGSYVLTENLLVTNTGVYGIDVQVNNVTIDMNGFTLTGPGANSQDGIYQAITLRNLRVHNGKVVNWLASYKYGVRAMGVNNQFKDLQASSNYSGLFSGEGSVLIACAANNNSAAGITCMKGSIVNECSAVSNGDRGISVSAGSTVSKSCAYNNGMDGIHIDPQSVASECSANDNGDDGMSTGFGSAVINCVVSGNSNHGIAGSRYCTISGCLVWKNASNGIVVLSDSYVLNNTCAQNGYLSGDGAGISATEDHTRIENNHVMENDRGINIGAAGNLVIKNSANGNTGSGVPSADYDFNGYATTYGPIVSTNGLITNVNPWANFEF